MSPGLDFIKAEPKSAARRLDGQTIHLWRLPYAMSQGRAPLVGLLAAYLGVREPDVVLQEGTRGKPELAPMPAGLREPGHPVANPALSFNWSHSGDYALVALSSGGALGVDIERLGKNLRALEIARRFFDPSEADALATLEPDARKHAFIGLWCAKEAVLKAEGEGLAFGLDRLVFTRCNETDWQLERVDPTLGCAGAWQLSGFAAAPGYRGAVAWRGSQREIRAFQPA